MGSTLRTEGTSGVASATCQGPNDSLEPMDKRRFDIVSALDFEAVLTQYLGEASSSANTKRSYEGVVRAYGSWARDKGFHPLAVDVHTVNQYLSAVIARDNFEQSSKVHTFRVLRAFFDFVARRWEVHSPFRVEGILQPADMDEQRVNVLPVSVHGGYVRGAMELAPSSRLAVLLIAVNGLRTGELLAANIDDVYEAEGELRLRIPSRSDAAWTPLLGPLRQAYEEVNKTHGNALFVTRNIRRWDRNALARVLNSIARKTGLPKVNARSLRQTAGSIALYAGLSPMGLQEMLGIDSRSVARYFGGPSRVEEHGASRVLRHARLTESEDELLGEVARLLSEDGVNPIAPIVLAGAALERHLRIMSQEHGGFQTELGSLDKYKGYLRKQGAIGSREVTKIDRWRDVRNDAAHGRKSLTRDDAKEMARGVREFLASHT